MEQAPPLYGKWLPLDNSIHGAGIDRIIFWVHVLMIALFVGWGAYYIYCLVRFRHRAGHKATYEPIKGAASKYVEVFVLVAELLLLFALSMPIWAEYRTVPADLKDPVEVRVVGQQFQWNAHYPGPDGVFGQTKLELVNEQSNPLGVDESDPAAADDIYPPSKLGQGQFHMPVGRPVIVHLRSKDVIHSFFIPVLRIKQDAIPGMSVPIHFEAKAPGTFEIACAQLCGLGHYKMRAEVHMQTNDDYNAWVQKASQPAEEFSEEELE